MSQNPATRRVPEFYWMVFIFLLVFTIHGLSPVVQSTDSHLALYTAEAIRNTGRPELDAYPQIADNENIWRANGHIYNKFPLGTVWLIIPAMLVIDPNATLLQSGYPYALEIIVAALIVALTTVILYRIVRLRLTIFWSLALVFSFAFGTAMWSTASRGLWQHGPSMLVISAILLLTLTGQDHRRQFLVGCLIVLAYAIRPTNAITGVIFALVYFRRSSFWLGVFVAGVAFVGYNLVAFNAPLQWYYTTQNTSFAGVPIAAFGHLFAPSRGLLIFSPLLLISLLGAVVSIRRQTLFNLGLLALLALHYAAISLFRDWSGGSAFGPRYWTDVMPIFAYFAIDGLLWVQKKRVILASFAVLVLISVWINWRGATRTETFWWNNPPENIPQRAWDWSDIQFLR